MAKRRRRKGPAEVVRAVPAEQIPWTTDVEVVRAEPGGVVLRLGPVTATILPDGGFDLLFHAPSVAPRHMAIDRETSFELQARHAAMDDASWMEWLRHWAEPPPVLSFREGRVVREWPGTGAVPPRRLLALGVDDTGDWGRTHFKGTRFRFAHFKTKEGEEGAVIQHFDPETGGFHSPWVHMGDFAEFVGEMSLDYPSDSSEEWREFNDAFGNAFMWALERMGSFDEPGGLRPDVVEAIKDDPEALIEESVWKMLPRLWEYPTALQEAVLDWAFSRGLVKDVVKSVEAAARAAGKPAVAAYIKDFAEGLGLGAAR